MANGCRRIRSESENTTRFLIVFFYFYRVFTEFSKRERNEETSGRVRPLAFFFPIWNFFFILFRFCGAANRRIAGATRRRGSVNVSAVNQFVVTEFFFRYSFTGSFIRSSMALPPLSDWSSPSSSFAERRWVARSSFSRLSISWLPSCYRVFFLRTVTVGRVASGHNNKNRLGKKKNSVKKLGRTPVDELGGGDLASF